jgi:hypothetical protein
MRREETVKGWYERAVERRIVHCSASEILRYMCFLVNFNCGACSPQGVLWKMTGFYAGDQSIWYMRLIVEWDYKRPLKLF